MTTFLVLFIGITFGLALLPWVLILAVAVTFAILAEESDTEHIYNLLVYQELYPNKKDPS